jgi:hypothetical protein
MLEAGITHPTKSVNKNIPTAEIAAAPFLFVLMAILTACAGVVLAMAFDATVHGGYVGCSSHDIHLADLAMTHFSFSEQRRLQTLWG